MRKMLLAVLMVGSGSGMLLLFAAVLVLQILPAEFPYAQAVMETFPMRVPETELWILQIMEYKGPFLENPEVGKSVQTAAVLVENRGGLYVSAGAVILQRQDDQLVFEIRDLPPGAQALVLEKDAQPYMGVMQWQCCGWTREEYPEQQGWVQFSQLPQGLAVTNVADHCLPGVQLTYKRRSAGSHTYVGGISYHYTLCNLGPGETKILSLPYYVQDRIQIVKTIVFYDD